jgi:hypothetical protein
MYPVLFCSFQSHCTSPESQDHLLNKLVDSILISGLLWRNTTEARLMSSKVTDKIMRMNILLVNLLILKMFHLASRICKELEFIIHFLKKTLLGIIPERLLLADSPQVKKWFKK